MDVVKHTKGPPLSLIGKIPALPDFVREHPTRAVTWFDQWLSRGMSDLHAASQRLPSVLIRFAMRVPEGDRLLLGAATPSSDHVGRSYPLALLCDLSSAPWTSAWPGTMLATGATYDALQALAFEVPALGLAELRERLADFAPPEPGALTAAAEVAARALGDTPARDFLARVFPGAEPAAICYGLHTFCTAFDSSRARGQGPGVVLDCPIHVDVDLMAWLELAEQLGGQDAISAVFWVEEPDPRMLLCVGTPPTQTLTFLANGSRKSQQLWPLHTSIDAARAHAEQLLGPQLASALAEPAANLGALWQALARRTERRA